MSNLPALLLVISGDPHHESPVIHTTYLSEKNNIFFGWFTQLNELGRMNKRKERELKILFVMFFFLIKISRFND